MIGNRLFTREPIRSLFSLHVAVFKIAKWCFIIKPTACWDRNISLEIYELLLLLTLIWVGFLRVCFEVWWVGGGGKITPYLKLVIIMLEAWNLVHKYTHKFNIADVSIFVQKMSVFLAKIIPLLKAIVWELCWKFFSSKLAINPKNNNDVTICWHDLIINFFSRLFCLSCQV